MEELILYNRANFAAETASIDTALSLFARGSKSDSVMGTLRKGVTLCEQAARWWKLAHEPGDYFSQETLEQEAFVRSLVHIPVAQHFFQNIGQVQSDLSYLVGLQAEQPSDVPDRVAQIQQLLSPLSIALSYDDALQEKIQSGEFQPLQ